MMTIQASKFTPEVLLSAPRRSPGVPNPSGTKALYTVSFPDGVNPVMICGTADLMNSALEHELTPRVGVDVLVRLPQQDLSEPSP